MDSSFKYWSPGGFLDMSSILHKNSYILEVSMVFATNFCKTNRSNIVFYRVWAGIFFILNEFERFFLYVFNARFYLSKVI